MAKREYGYRAGAVFVRSGQVVLTGWVDDGGPDHDRPLQSAMSPADARKYAAQLVEAADKADGVEPERPKGRLAEKLGVAAPIDFTEERPGVWKTATPEDGARLDAQIDDALASLGTSLVELREAETHVTANGDSHTHLSTDGGTHTVCGKAAAALAKAVSFTCPDCQHLMQRR